MTQKPEIALVELMLPKMNALTILKQIKTDIPDATASATKVVILSSQANVINIKECIKWGAVDYLLKPLEVEDFVSRIVFHLQPSRSATRTEERNETGNLYLHLVELVLQQINNGSNLNDVLFRLSQMTAMSLKSVRASIVKIEPNRQGLVKASSDDPKGNEWNLDLRKYPEILFVANTGKTLVVENLDNDPTLNQIKKLFANISFNSMIVVPIYSAPEQLYGVITIRMPPNRHQIQDDEIRFAQILTQCISIALRLLPPKASKQAS